MTGGRIFQIELVMNTTIMLTYYYDDPSDSNDTMSLVTNSSRVTPGEDLVTSTPVANSHSLAMRDHAANPALVHHLYLGLGHMGKVGRQGLRDERK